MSIGVITALMFAAALFFLALGMPVSFCLGGVAVAFTLWLWGPAAFYVQMTQVFAATTNFLLISLPLFIFMAMILERSGISDALYNVAYHWMGGLRGGLAMGTVVICTIFAAMVGITGAATVTMGLIALPSMLKYNYDKSIAIGCISAGGALGVLIPPSVLMILYAFFANESVGAMFLGGVFPGLLLSGLFIAYIGIRSYLQPHVGPAVPPQERLPWRQKFVLLRGVILPIIIVISVLGAIFSGAATPSEAGAIGSLASIVCAAIYRRLNWQVLKEACYRCVQLSTMVMFIVCAGICFGSVYNALGAPELIRSTVAAMGVSRWVVLAGIQLTFFILGCLIDQNTILILTTPIYVPLITSLGFDPLWFGVVFVVNMEMGYLTPPFGYNLFYMKGVVPPGITMGDIYRSITPFVVLQAIGLVLVIIFPEIALWLPSLLIYKG